ncbi:CvpA family protein [Benzoatithermus flavus]|uniref:CvpA family protein n=1 Tax=Benzoatithermus flavus TaxID=3108223 RepID=A0ABU8XRZ5_9PROT
MHELPLTLFDAFVIVVVGLSALVALTRGAVAEILGLLSWVVAGIAAVAVQPRLTPMVRQAVANDTVAAALAVAGAFIVVLVVCKIVAGVVVRAVESSPLGPLDKLLGLVVGALKGAVLVAVAYLVASSLIKPELQPRWVQEAYLIEPVREGSALLARLVPERYRREGLAAAGAADGAIEDEAARATGGHGSTTGQRQVIAKPLPPAPQR